MKESNPTFNPVSAPQVPTGVSPIEKPAQPVPTYQAPAPVETKTPEKPVSDPVPQGGAPAPSSVEKSSPAQPVQQVPESELSPEQKKERAKEEQLKKLMKEKKLKAKQQAKPKASPIKADGPLGGLPSLKEGGMIPDAMRANELKQM